MTESKERELAEDTQVASAAALMVVERLRDGWCTVDNGFALAIALEDCIDERIRRSLPIDCQPRECHEYQTELIAERDKLKAEVATLDEELQQVDDLVEELGGSRDRGPVAFIRDLHVERNAARADRDRLQRDLAAMTEQLTLAVKMNDEIHAADRTANELRAAFTAEKAAHEATRKELANMTKARHDWACISGRFTLRVSTLEAEIESLRQQRDKRGDAAIAELESLRSAHEGALASIQAEREAQAEMRADMLTMEAELESLRSKPLEAELAGALLKDCEHVHHSTQDDFTAHAAFSRVESALRNALRSRGSADVVPLEGELAEDAGMLRAHLTSSNVYQGDMLAALARIESALRTKPVATEPLDGDLAEDEACLRYAVITKNQKFALDHIALRASGAQERSRISAADIDHLEQGCAEAFVSLQVRARAGEMLAAHQSEWLSAEAARLRAKGAQEPVGPDPVSVLDGWRQRDPQRRQWVVGSRFGQVMVSLQRQGETLAVEFGATEHEARKRMADLIRSGYCDGVEQQPAAPTDEDLANQRLLNREDYYCGACKRQMPRAEARAHVCEEQPAAAPEPRAIVVGSKWRWHDSQSVDTVIAVMPREPYIRARLPSGEEIDPAESLFRAQHTWLSDPPAPAAPELPRKVEPGTTLTVGARYRITEVSPGDSSPRHKVGDELLCRPEDSDTPGLYTQWFLEEYWFASDGSAGTFVTGLDLIADAPKAGR